MIQEYERPTYSNITSQHSTHTQQYMQGLTYRCLRVSETVIAVRVRLECLEVCFWEEDSASFVTRATALCVIAYLIEV
jgi:hypothetical protein